MASIDCVLDTTPMANEIHTVSRHVDGTTTAVVAMQTAVVKAESDAADHVCRNVNRGFYSMIHSQISQKIAKLQSDVDSWLMKLNTQRKQLAAIRTRMERDYQMITHRYMKLFGGLNRNLKERITAIDRPILDFAGKEMDRTSNRTNNLTALVPVMQQEALSTSQSILAGEVKMRGVKAIEAMSRFLAGVKDQDDLTRQVLLPQSMAKDSQTVMLPVIISEANFDASGSKVVQVYADSWIPKSGVDQIRQANATLAWGAPKGADAQVASDFHRLLAEGRQKDRVKKMAAHLFQKSRYSSL